jgi:hypothetical protein
MAGLVMAGLTTTRMVMAGSTTAAGFAFYSRERLAVTFADILLTLKALFEPLFAALLLAGVLDIVQV